MGHSADWVQRASVEVAKDWNGIVQVALREPRGASARVSLHGGQAIFKPPKAMRGGIPICFPQFGSCGLLEQHGFARNKVWTSDDDPPPFSANACNTKSAVDLLLKPSEDDLNCWPHNFEFRLRVALGVGGDLAMISCIRNVDSKPFSFSFAYHAYFSVSDISEVRIEGLETLDYLDNLCHRERFTEQGDAITFESEHLQRHLSLCSSLPHGNSESQQNWGPIILSSFSSLLCFERDHSKLAAPFFLSCTTPVSYGTALSSTEGFYGPTGPRIEGKPGGLRGAGGEEGKPGGLRGAGGEAGSKGKEE
ncbi:hypothetical protein AMTR_s00158p00073760 [Amborella trichopoda]|uniref:Glucose-6-phosphate 1-epimerase n=1 Tax=Amborella trichopoda TaxID=13333 RepID=W1PTB9_AMBTC|nr:hypothetical protein AMTR_s00158p00073760 [Amborella trichopoda]